MKCDECERELEPAEPIWLHWKPQGEDAKNRTNDYGTMRTTARLVSICEPCRPLVHRGKFVLGLMRKAIAAGALEIMDAGFGDLVHKSPDLPMKPCEICGRSMGMEWRMVGTQRWRCSWDCRRARQPRPIYKQTCVICHTAFTARRDDAKTCSPACRQKAYRQRAAGG